MTSSNSDKIILLLDDEQDILHLFQDSLELWGYQTIYFTNPIDALNYIDTDNNISKCSLIITDYRMPQMDGIDFIQQIRKRGGSIQNENSQLKVILISAFVISQLTLKEKKLNLKIDKIIEKPIPLEYLKQEIERLLHSNY